MNPRKLIFKTFAAVILVLVVYLIVVPDLLSSESVLLILLGVAVALVPILFLIDFVVDQIASKKNGQ